MILSIRQVASLASVFWPVSCSSQELLPHAMSYKYLSRHTRRRFFIAFTNISRKKALLGVCVVIVLCLTLRHTSNIRALVTVDRTVPVVWIGGVPRSGTTLMRAMLDAHPSVRCGAETRVIPRVLSLHRSMLRSDSERKRLHAAGLTDDVLNSALAAYILSIVSRHGPSAPRLCNKDPFSLRFVDDLLRMFPASRFILMLRDGRAVAHSLISRKVTIKGFDTSSYRGAITSWNRAVASMYAACLQVGPSICHVLHYEKLVLEPRVVMERMLAFLGLPWHENVLHHEASIGDRIQLSEKEPSTDQVSRALNRDALSKWVGHIPNDVKQSMGQMAPMLQVLGYDPEAYPPRYSANPIVFDAPPLDLLNEIIRKAGNYSAYSLRERT